MQRGINKEPGTAKFISMNPPFMKDGREWRNCTKCRTDKLVIDYYKGRAKCKECTLEEQALTRVESREWLYQYKVTKPCTDCGDYFHPACMQFDHLPEFEKERILSTMAHYSRERFMKELAKCELVCANCHMLRSYLRRAHTIKDKWYEQALADGARRGV